jgi:hypothetical protein
MRGEVKLPVLCTARMLGGIGNASRLVATQLLRECGARRVDAGRRVLISMAEIEKKIPLLFQGLRLVASTRRRREGGKWQ